MLYMCIWLYFRYMLFFIFSEGELEEVLTTYTKINKSASIFLGGNPKHSSGESNRATPQGRPPSGTSQKSTAGELSLICHTAVVWNIQGREALVLSSGENFAKMLARTFRLG